MTLQNSTYSVSKKTQNSLEKEYSYCTHLNLHNGHNVKELLCRIPDNYNDGFPVIVKYLHGLSIIDFW